MPYDEQGMAPKGMAPNMPPNLPQQAPDTGLSVSALMQGFSRLSPQERQLLDQMINPQIGEILIKVFGEELRQIIQPFMGGQAIPQTPSMPSPDNPLNNVRS